MADFALCFDQTCPVCGKRFVRYNDAWAYKIGTSYSGVKFFCSWKCLRRYERTHPQAKYIAHGTR